MEASRDSRSQGPLVFLDTSAFFTLAGCTEPQDSRDSIEELSGGYRVVLHQVHYDEAVRRLSDAVMELINTGRDGDECLTRLAQQVLQRLPAIRGKSLSAMGRQKLAIRRAAQRLIWSIVERLGLSVLDDGREPPNSIPGCQGLSDEDALLVELARECNIVASGDYELLQCCRALAREDGKCLGLS